MELRTAISFLQRRLWFILAGTMVVAGLTYIISWTLTPIYAASVTLLVEQGVDPRSDSLGSLETSRRSAITFESMLLEPPVLARVVDELALPFGAEVLRNKASVRTLRETQLIHVSAEDAEPALAAAMADKIAEVFIEQNRERQQARFDAAKKQLDAEIQALAQQIEETQVAIASEEAARTGGRETLPSFVRAELARLESKLASDQTRYNILLSSAENFRLTATRDASNLSIVSRAETPRTPVSPDVPLNAVLGGIAGLLVSLVIASVVEYLDDTVKSDDEVEKLLHLPAVGTVPRLTADALSSSFGDPRELGVGADGSRSPAAEAFRVLRTNLDLSRVDKPVQTLLVTSAAPSEGKTFTAANLAVASAQAGKRVILVDADLRRPSAHRLFGLANGQGLTNLILDPTIDLSVVLQNTNVSGLRVLLGGPIPPNPAELLGSNHMRQVLASLRTQSDTVIFDSPPVLLVADAAILSSQMDGTLLVVESARTRTDIVKRAVDALTKVGGTIIGVSLNKVARGRRGGYYYYYAYSYYYGGDGEHRRRRARRGGRRRTFLSLLRALIPFRGRPSPIGGTETPSVPVQGEGQKGFVDPPR
ncbi:MAG: polysaccharide biosynthesis tyrosine autokinase [Chloroflexi bacterium]|nr:polysaccharide biosynthesis tyrosine autokinase [Chloroflexota bacterium]